jgi:Zn-dependent peptidase ImmA (M78 family)
MKEPVPHDTNTDQSRSPVRLSDFRPPADADGIWDDETKTIYIRKRLPMTRRRYILAHELGHAWLDWQHRHLDEGKAST